MSVAARTPSSDPSRQPHVWLFAVEIVSRPAQSHTSARERPVDWEPGVRVTSLWRPQFPPASEEAGLNGVRALLRAMWSAVLWVWQAQQASP